MKTDTKLTIVMWFRVLVRSTHRHLAAVSAGYQLASSLSTCLGNCSTARPALNLQKPVQAKQRAFYYVYQKGCVFPPIQILSVQICYGRVASPFSQKDLLVAQCVVCKAQCVEQCSIDCVQCIVQYLMCSGRLL